MPSVFYARPDNTSNLVRFIAHDLTAPAGRLRVYDTARRLLGTAGMLGGDGRLRGELWLPLQRTMIVVSELEAPGLRGVLRTRHSLEPATRWTVHWTRIVDLSALRERLDATGPLGRILSAGIARELGIRLNPLAPDRPSELDHFDFLRSAAAPRAGEPSLPISPLAVAADPILALPTTPLPLAGAGSDIVLFRSGEAAAWHWWEAPDGSRVLAVAVPRENNSDALAFAASHDAMAREIESAILRLPANYPTILDGRSARAVLIVLDTSWEDDDDLKLANVRAWNRKYSRPSITMGDARELSEWLARMRRASLPTSRPVGATPLPTPTAPDLSHRRERRLTRRRRRDVSLFGVLVHALTDGADSRAGPPEEIIARNVATDFSGFVVFNPTPVRRTEPVALPDAREIVVTDVPAIGYAFVPSAILDPDPVRQRPADSPRSPSSLVAEGRHLALGLDERSGAIRSLVSTGDREWTRADSDGMNAVPGAILEHVTREEIPSLGTRLTAKRWSPDAGEITSTVTVFDALPWLEIANTAHEPMIHPAEYYFHFALEAPVVAWEIPGGHERRSAPVTGVTHLRWLALCAASGSVVTASDGALTTTVLDDGTLISAAPPQTVRHRLLPSESQLSLEETWRFGWLGEPLKATHVPPERRGHLPRFGSLFTVDRPGTGIVGLTPASDGDAVIAWLMEMSGDGGIAALRWGVLGFETAEIVDFAERYLGPPAGQLSDGVLLSMPAHGAVAVRLRGVGLNV